MLKMIEGCKVLGAHQLQEQYEVSEFAINANVNANKIKDVLHHFIVSQEAMLFFILELPSNKDDEKILRKNDFDPMHKDIYYMDGLNMNKAFILLERYGNLLINDGLSSFGFGLHDNTAEIMVRKYNVVTLWSNTMEKYDGFFEVHDIHRTNKLVTAWDTFNNKTPGECFRYEVDGESVFSLPDELKEWGIYFAERREE